MAHEVGGHEPGWYPDPEKPNRLRYWDGRTWTAGRAGVLERRRSHSGLYAFIAIAVLTTACALVFAAWNHRGAASHAAPVDATAQPGYHGPPGGGPIDECFGKLCAAPGLGEPAGPAQSVVVSKCQMGDLNGVSIEATVTNRGSQAAAFLVSVNLEDERGVVIGSGANGSPYLAPNQTGYVAMEAIARLRPARFRCVVANVERRPGAP